jgi:hypothetical protein
MDSFSRRKKLRYQDQTCLFPPSLVKSGSGKIPSVTLSPDASDLQNKHAYFDPPVMDRIWYDTSTRRSDNRASLSRQKLVHESPVGD